MANRSNTVAPRRSFRNQKKQTRLQFSPLPSSSPAKGEYSQAVQNRLANVRHNGAKHIYPSMQAQEDDEVNTPPTPAPSSQPQQLATGTLIHENVARSFTIPSDLSSSPLSDPPPSSPKVSPTQGKNDIKGDIEDEDDILPPSSKRRKAANLSDEIGTHQTPSRRSKRLQHGLDSPFNKSSSDQSVISVEIPTLNKPKNDLSDIGTAESSGDEDIVLASRATTRRKSNITSLNDPFIVDDNSSSENVRWSKLKTPKKRRKDPDVFVVDDDDVEYVSSDNVDHATKTSTSNARTPRSNRNKRLKNRRRQAELREDLEDLQDFEPSSSIPTSRTRGGPVTTKRDAAREHLALLKRRRAGEKIPRVRGSEDEDELEGYEGRDLSLIGVPDNDTYDHSSVQSSTASDPGITRTEDDYEENLADLDEDDFVVDDIQDSRNRSHPDIPLEFTQFASAKPRELFPHIIEWLIKNKLAPAFSRNDALYELAFNRVGDQVQAQAGSRLISSAWNATFKWTILARPNISIETLPGLDEDNIRTCDACNKTNHPARYDFVLSGEAYSKTTLEPLDNSDDEDEYDDGASRDDAGHGLALQDHHFYLGSHCAANAQMGHKLTHWRYHLNEAVLNYLDEQNVLLDTAIVARDKMNKKKREREAEAIVDSMQETGKINELWKDFQNDIDDARLGMEDYTRKGGRSQGRIGVIRSSGADGTVREWRDNKYTETKVALSDSEGD